MASIVNNSDENGIDVCTPLIGENPGICTYTHFFMIDQYISFNSIHYVPLNSFRTFKLK